MAKNKRKKGPGKYQQWVTDEGLIKIEGWACDGLTDEQIAHNIGIQRTTLYDWKNKYPDISDTLKKGKEVIDRQVENALLKRALGYGYAERTAKVVDRDPEVVEVERRDYEHRYKLDNPEAKLQEIKDAAIIALNYEFVLFCFNQGGVQNKDFFLYKSLIEYEYTNKGI